MPELPPKNLKTALETPFRNSDVYAACYSAITAKSESACSLNSLLTSFGRSRFLSNAP